MARVWYPLVNEPGVKSLVATFLCNTSMHCIWEHSPRCFICNNLFIFCRIHSADDDFFLRLTLLFPRLLDLRPPGRSMAACCY